MAESQGTEFPIVDVHSHIYDKSFEQDIDEVISKAKEIGVAATLVVPEGIPDFQKVLDLADRYPDFVVPCLGLHPVQPPTEEEGERSVTVQDYEKALPLLEAHREKIAAIGEVGLDFTPRYCPLPEHKDGQREVFSRQIKLAQKFDIPVNCHSRSAGIHVINLLKELGATKVLLHAFDGKPASAMAGVEAGYYFSIPPSICRSTQKQKLVSAVPISNLLLETDSPACGPDKGRNVPANISISLEYVAKIKKMSVAEVQEITTQNAIKLFPTLAKFVRR